MCPESQAFGSKVFCRFGVWRDLKPGAEVVLFDSLPGTLGRTGAGKLAGLYLSQERRLESWGELMGFSDAFSLWGCFCLYLLSLYLYYIKYNLVV